MPCILADKNDPLFLRGHLFLMFEVILRVVGNLHSNSCFHFDQWYLWVSECSQSGEFLSQIEISSWSRGKIHDKHACTITTYREILCNNVIMPSGSIWSNEMAIKWPQVLSPGQLEARQWLKRTSLILLISSALEGTFAYIWGQSFHAFFILFVKVINYG